MWVEAEQSGAQPFKKNSCSRGNWSALAIVPKHVPEMDLIDPLLGLV